MTPEREMAIRVGVFVGSFAVLGLLELLAPRRPLSDSKRARWLNNLGPVAIDAVVLRILFPTAAVGVALVAQKEGFGLFHHFAVPPVVSFAASLVVLDLVVYLQHVLFHAAPALWAFHVVHHADLDFDVTTGSRFHPVEMVLSMTIKIAVVAALGPPVLAVLVFEVVLNCTAMFNHPNLFLPEALDRALRLVLVAPDMHRVHHSVRVAETSSNFGFNLSWWDRLLGTYRAQPAEGHERMTLGLAQFRDASTTRLGRAAST